MNSSLWCSVSFDLIFMSRRAICHMLDLQKKLGLAHFPVEIQKARQRLRADIKNWRSQQQEVMPLVTDLVADLENVQPDNEILYLPSDISPDQHIAYGLSQLAAEELQLREGEAYDALDSVRQAVKYTVCLRADKHKHATGQSMNLRAGDMVRDAEEKQAKCVAKYQHARRAMIGLGRSPEYLQAEFPEMKPQDLWMKDVSEKREVGDGRITEGWIWWVGAWGNMSDEERDAFSEESE
jgi:hypothetical protein